MDFRSFSKNAPKNEKPATAPIEQKVSKEETRKIEDMAKKYSGKSENELMSEILGRVNQSKQNGTFNPEEFDKFYKTVAPMLNEEQLKKLKTVLSKIK